MEQDAMRARTQIEAFAAERGLRIAGFYVENESGAKLARPELFRLLSDSHPGDILLVEQVDRLSRLTAADWKQLRVDLSARHIGVVALDLRTSHQLAAPADEFTGRVLAAINDLMLDLLAATARKDYIDRRRRVTDGQARAKAQGRYKGRPEDAARNGRIARMLHSKFSWTQIQETLGCSRGTLAKVAARLRQEQTAA
jgi:DNA invertase Pin-like site-specific DNA recombinase